MDDHNRLVDGVVARDAQAFEALYDRFSRLVFGIAFRMLGDADAAEDIVQIVFLKFWNTPTNYRGGSFPAWIARVARNQALDQLRHRSRTFPTTMPADAPVEQALDEEVFARLDGARVRQALADIPHEQRLPIELGFFCGITHEEISRRIETPLGTVKTRIRSGLQKMRHALINNEVAL